jgi:hypothetical protein
VVNVVDGNIKIKWRMRSPLIGSFEISVDQNKQTVSKTYTTKVSQMLLIRAI